MKYLEWNNIISAYFFSPTNAGKDIYLYLTRKDIINIARQYFNEETEDEIWASFITSIKRGIPGSNGNVISKAKFAHSKNNFLNLKRQDGTPLEIDGVPIIYPPYISYLVFIVLPLIENVENDNQRVNNYYGRLNSFLQHNQINENIGTTDFSTNQINRLWEDLADWANLKNNGDLGLFNVIPFTNANWVYVGKIFSQCVFPPKILSRLPELFEYIGLVPDASYEDQFLQEKIRNSGTALISKNTLDFLKKEDELSNTIIQIIQRQYKSWTGETHEEIEDGAILRKKRNYTVAPLFLQFKVNINDEEIKFSYRMYSLNDYPEDLKLGEIENLYEANGWSKTLPFDFRESLELKDNFNKWIAKHPNRDVRLFISAGTFQLSASFWLETNILSKTEPMYLLCRNEKKATIEEWGASFRNGNFLQEDLDGLPQNYSLFKILNPTESHKEIPLLTLYTEKHIELVGGLKVNFRTFINDFLPEVEIINSNGTEKVYLQYKETDEKIFLSRKETFNNRWLLPEDVSLNSDFYIKIQDERFSANEIAYNFTCSNNTAIKVAGLQLTKRDSFGRCAKTVDVQYCLGSNVINPNKSSKRYFCASGSLFTSTVTDLENSISRAEFYNHGGNKLCSFMSLKGSLTTEEFFKAFEFYFLKEFSEQQVSSNLNLTQLKRASINFYDFIGILDYDYETKKIVVNPTQFIFIPAAKGRKVLLIGARDSALVEEIIEKAPNYHLQVKITKQRHLNQRLLLPDVIIIKAFGTASENYGERNLIEFANELQINFSNDYFPQIALQDFSANIHDYEETMQLIDENDYDWARYIFNPETLSFEKSETTSFDQSFSLVKYKLNEYTQQYKLWKENKCYQIDMNWGRFLAMNHFGKNVIFFDRESHKVAIPIELPLPRLLAESIMLLSGLAPDFRMIEERKYRVYENIPSVFTVNLFRKLGQTPINKSL